MSERLQDWWVNSAEKEIGPIAKKAAEYGSNSLEQVGRKLAGLQGRQVSKEEALELGCWMYMIGKAERWTDAVMRGERPSTDSLIDLSVYARMAIRIREVGDWPGKTKSTESNKETKVYWTGNDEDTELDL